MSNAEIRRTAKFKAYVRAVRLAEEIDAELADAMARSPRKPTEIHELQDRLMEILAKLIPYEKPRLSAVKVSGDKRAPLFDLSGFSSKELLLIRRLILKASQIAPTEEEEEEISA
jgi:hypothetical protein